MVGPTRGGIHLRYSLQGHGRTQASPPRQGSNTWEGSIKSILAQGLNIEMSELLMNNFRHLKGCYGKSLVKDSCELQRGVSHDSE